MSHMLNATKSSFRLRDTIKIQQLKISILFLKEVAANLLINPPSML